MLNCLINKSSHGQYSHGLAIESRVEH